MFDLAEAYRARGDAAAAEQLLRAMLDNPEVEIRAEARFRLGMMLSAQKRWRDAALLFRRLLDEKPGAVRVRLELARVLAAMGDADAARRQLRQAEAGGLPPEVAVVVDQFANALRSTRRFGGSFELALAPDSNVNRATRATTLDTVIAPLTLSDDARARSGVGLALSGQGYARLRLSPAANLVARLSGSGNFYEARQFDDLSVSLAAGPELNVGRDRLQPSLVATRRYYGGAFYARTDGGAVNASHAIGRRAQLEVAASAARARYARNPIQDGGIYSGSVSLERAFTARFGGSVSLSADRQTARDPGYATRSAGPSVVVWRDLGRATVYAAAAYRHLAADARVFLFPALRTDDFVRLSAGATLRKLGFAGLAPTIRATWERNRSTVGIYDYRRLSFQSGITRAF